MKKKILISLFLLPLVGTLAFSKTYSNKTFMMPRSQLDNLPLQVSSWHTQFMKKHDHKFAGSVQASGFYQKSDNKRNLGQYFGYYAKEEEVKRDFISVMPLTDPNNIDFESDDIPVNYIYHDPDLVSTTFGGQIKFSPNQESYGLRLDYYQNLWNFFLKVNLPIVEVKNSMGVSGIGEVPLTHLFESNLFYTLFDYFEGKIEYLNHPASNQLQKKLTHAKFGGTHNECGIADMNVSLGYTFLNRHNCRAGLAVNVTIPTGKDAHGEWLFEPIIGNGEHWGLGVELDSKLRLWDEGKGRDAIDLLIFANLKYLFEDTEHRTLGLLNNEGEKIRFAHYFLAGKRGELEVFPLANVLNQKVSVDPGLQFELLTAFAFNANNVTFDLGYNLFIKNCEDIHLKNHWHEDTYAIANPGYPGTVGYETIVGTDPQEGPFDPTRPAHYDIKTIPGPITHENLDVASVRTPSVMTHKVYGALSYALYEWQYPLMLGLGASYEFDSGNAALEGYNLWAKASVSF